MGPSQDKVLHLVLAALLTVMAMIAGFLITRLARDALAFAFGVWLAIYAAVVLGAVLTILALELGASTPQRRRTPFRAPNRQGWGGFIMSPIRRLLCRPPGPDPIPLTNLESSPRYPWNPDRSSTIGRPYAAPRVLVTATGLPRDWDRPDNTRPIAAALASMRGRTVRVVAPPGDRGRARTAERGTQTAMRNIRGPRAEERMPGGMAPMRFWWLLLEEQRQNELARAERERRRWSS